MCPYKSVAQQKFFHSAGAAKAGITPQEVEEFDQSTKAGKGYKNLPAKSPQQMKEKRTKAKNRHK